MEISADICVFKNKIRSKAFLYTRITALIGFTMACLSCARASVSTLPPKTLEIAGSTALLPVLSDLTEEFSRRHPQVTFDLRGGGSSLGEEQLGQGKLDLAMTTLARPDSQSGASRSTQPQPEVTSDLALPAEGTTVSFPIALDAVALVVHAGNKLDEISLNELKNVYSGRIFDWSELGGTAGEILLISREESSWVRQFFEDRIMGDEQVSLTAVVMPTNADVLRYAALHPHAIGYLSRSYVTSELAPQETESEDSTETDTRAQRALVRNSFLSSLRAYEHKVKVVRLDGQLPTVDAVHSQRYYLVHPLYLLTDGEPEGWSALFIEFVLSPAGQSIVERYHVPVR